MAQEDHDAVANAFKDISPPPHEAIDTHRRWEKSIEDATSKALAWGDITRELIRNAFNKRGK